ncbi:ROK family protein [Lacisediminihabitans sp.]|uniref:ROK family transcriptional regulator n=1 Tax=Lacisediminihabitans sp. TaxID=2787631 RepID=UPI00374CFD5B
MRLGTNLPAVGGYNQKVILDVIRRTSGGLSRVELAEATGLSAQTVSNVSRRLLADGLIREAGTSTDGGVGKPRTILQLEARGRFAVGVHLDPSVITLVLLDLAGSVVTHSRMPAPSAVSSEETIDRIAEAVESLIASSGVSRDRIVGVGVAAPGPVDLGRGIMLNPPLLSGWQSVPLRDALLQRLALPVLVEKDVTAAAVAELWMGDVEDRGNFAFFYYGTGTGMGVVLGGEVIRGASGNAGDIGHILVTHGGELCSCGRRGCLGNVILPRLLVTDWMARSAGEPTGVELDVEAVHREFAALAALAEAGDDAARSVLEPMAGHIATGLVAIINLLDLDRVVFGGPFWHPVSAVLLGLVPDLVADSPALVAPHAVAFEESEIGEDVAAVGAACLVLDNTFSPRPDSLLLSPSVRS